MKIYVLMGAGEKLVFDNFNETKRMRAKLKKTKSINAFMLRIRGYKKDKNHSLETMWQHAIDWKSNIATKLMSQ